MRMCLLCITIGSLCTGVATKVKNKKTCMALPAADEPHYFKCKANKPCAANPCLNGGTCVEVSRDTVTCKCPNGFAGEKCHLTVAPTGDCIVDNINPPEDFDLDRIYGRWYEIKWVPPTYYPEEEWWVDYQENWTALNDTHFAKMWLGRIKETDPYCSFGRGYMYHDTDVPGRFIYTRVGETTETPRWLVKTDYDNYAVIYGCREILPNGRCKMGKADVWLWSRTWQIQSDTFLMLDNYFKTVLCIDLNAFINNINGKECAAPPDAP